jgi:hypothetical protein
MLRDTSLYGERTAMRNIAKRITMIGASLLAIGVAAVLTLSNSAGAVGAPTAARRAPLTPVAAGTQGHKEAAAAPAGTGEVTLTHGQGRRLSLAEIRSLGLDKKVAAQAKAQGRTVDAGTFGTESTQQCYDILASNGGTALPGVAVDGAGGYQYVYWCGDWDTALLTAVQYQCIYQVTKPNAGAACTGETYGGGFGQEYFEYRTDWILCDARGACGNHYDDVVYEYNGNWTTIQRG